MLVAAGIIVGGLLSHLPLSRDARAADAAPTEIIRGARTSEPAPTAINPVGRYQLSAFGSGTNLSHEHGCYVLDTCTGKVWRIEGLGVTALGAVGK
jgi:hypothetical protein